MTAKLLFLILATSILPALLFSQDDKWFQKGLDTNDPQKTNKSFHKKH